MFFKGDITCGDFARADFGFNFGLDFKINIFNFEIIILKCGGDNSEVAITELFDIERVFDADNNVTIVVRDDGCTLEPS